MGNLLSQSYILLHFIQPWHTLLSLSIIFCVLMIAKSQVSKTIYVTNMIYFQIYDELEGEITEIRETKTKMEGEFVETKKEMDPYLLKLKVYTCRLVNKKRGYDHYAKPKIVYALSITLST